ncbi:glycosyltransferase family 2 protein [Meiothermus sp.]|uniref:glycosyltransferase family 2 protein n=1 Tax=Meiothermus sp. TaxID=1955249 RepID=UPI0021DC90B7|nr:glycosyltransferase family 2 protein [Meiothermus sp.]GIW34680.1 MAG: biofilm formation protein PslC [Meiothermus sp.]
MKVSVIIPTWKAEYYVRPLAEVLWRQTRKPLEIIIIDSSSPDQTAAIAKEMGCRVEVIPQSEFNHGETRNRAARLAKGETLVFMTQDALPVDEFFLQKLIEPIEQGRAVAAYARQIPYPDANPPEAFGRQFNYPAQSHLQTLDQLPQKGFKTFFYSDVASAVRAEVFWAMGGYPDWVIVDEDVYLCAQLLRAGHSVAYSAEARVWHSHNYSLSQQFRRLFDVGVFVSQAGEMLAGAKTSGEGLRFVRHMTTHLAQNGAWGWIVYGWLEAALKFLGYQMGRRHGLLPLPLKRHLSLHRRFWDASS